MEKDSFPPSQMLESTNSLIPKDSTTTTEQGKSYFDEAYDTVPINAGLIPRSHSAPPRSPSFFVRNKKWILGALGLLLLLILLAIALPLGLILGRRNSGDSGARDSGDSSGRPTSNARWSGGNGSTVTTENGTTFTYVNDFGGYWDAVPFSDTARAQSDVPALNETWDYNTNLIHGVNIGGWLVIEPFIVPELFEPFNQGDYINLQATVIDEWSLSEALGDRLSEVVTQHYQNFYTEQDFALIAGAGLNWVRIPLPFWAVEDYDGVPMLPHVAWDYFLKAIAWCRKYGLRINLDLHTAIGSQNGYNHSGKQGQINFLNGVMGLANAQRTLNIIRSIAQFIAQPEYSRVIPMFGVLNEPYAETIGLEALRHFYLETYNMLRGIGGIGEGKGQFIAWHDGFASPSGSITGTGRAAGWGGFLQGGDRMALDQHQYLSFYTPNNDSLSYQATKPCDYWSAAFNTSTGNFGLTFAGEWSLAINDCGHWLNNVGNGHRYDGTYYTPGNTTAPTFRAVGSCDEWNNWDTWTDERKADFRTIAQAHQDAFGHWFFWSWKVSYSTDMGKLANPMWSYSLGLREGYIPANPREARHNGVCRTIADQYNLNITFTSAPSLQPWMTGGAGAGTLVGVATAHQTQFAWPPASFGSTPVNRLPAYSPTGSITTLTPGSAPTDYPSGSSTVTPGNGWFNAQDTTGYYVPVSSCSYLQPWSAAGAPIPSAGCGQPAARMKREAPSATITAAPKRRRIKRT